MVLSSRDETFVEVRKRTDMQIKVAESQGRSVNDKTPVFGIRETGRHSSYNLYS